MWEERLRQLKKAYPEAIRFNPPITQAEVENSEGHLGCKLDDVDPAWLQFLEMTNGARVLDYRFMPALVPPEYGIILATQILRETNPWAMRKNYISFLSDTTGMDIGFVRTKSQTRCLAFLSESTEATALPIASSFTAFMISFLEDVETVLNSWGDRSEESLILQGISDYWPLDLQTTLGRDPALRTMLESGKLDDLFRDDEEYSSIVDSALRGTSQGLGKRKFPCDQS